MKIRLRFFASLREAVGAQELLEWEAPAPTVGEIRDALAARGGAWAEVLGRDRTVRAALNQSLCSEAAEVPADAELAFFPPVTGG